VAVAAAGDSYAVVSGSNGRLRAYDYESGRGGEILDAGQNRFESGTGQVVFSPDGKSFAVAGSGDQPGTFGVRIRDWPVGTVQHTLMGHTAPVTAITFSPDGKTLATGSQDTTVLLWELKDGK
jgi:WD40 repeat protein